MEWRLARAVPPVVCGHRGAPVLEAENTLAGFVAAGAHGATWIEFDVRPTRDGVLAIHHDPVTADGRRVSSSDFARLDPSIPSFDQLIEAVPRLGLDIEMKTDDTDMSIGEFAELVVDRVEVHCADRDDVMVTSFDAVALARVHELKPDLATGLLFSDAPEAAIARAVDVGHVAVAPWIRLLDAALVDRARAAALGIATWTVNEPGDVRLAASLGVDMIIGDDPRVIVEHR